MHARVVCKVTDVSPSRWSDVVVHGEATIEACALVARAECEGHGDVVRACSSDPLPPALVPRGVFVMRHEMPESVRYEMFATRDECESAKRERPVADEARAWLEAQINVETRELVDAKAAVKSAERKLADARARQDPDVPLAQLEVERLRRVRDQSEKLLAALREQREGQTPTIACLAAGGS